MTQLIYTMFISNNCASFHLLWKENLVKYQKVSKHYENDCSSNYRGEYQFSDESHMIACNAIMEKYWGTYI